MIVCGDHPPPRSEFLLDHVTVDTPPLFSIVLLDPVNLLLDLLRDNGSRDELGMGVLQ